MTSRTSTPIADIGTFPWGRPLYPSRSSLRAKSQLPFHAYVRSMSLNNSQDLSQVLTHFITTTRWLILVSVVGGRLSLSSSGFETVACYHTGSFDRILMHTIRVRLDKKL